ncbi:DUF5664 domain-containing protein [Saccharopolyspora indica]|uniref:dATP/dGTP diphosphohydrolase domain-containing protein n=1 Tax=Saccharopolyspora indica TaxID=1229659 RepID=UPI0022EB3B63|nr:dATP/dGTP diphosphohydrolase domain-containing protein [Saccharopolyspora indica]MDA3643813.1 DUF5664 domain-containing protein [Saccharopolyspora indica]
MTTLVSDRVQFEGGGMRDSEANKPRFDLLLPKGVPYEQQYLTRIARLMARGAAHYADRNWEQFSDQEALDRAKSSAFRHFMQWFTDDEVIRYVEDENGELYEVNETEDHAAAVAFNIMAAEHIKGKLSG